MSQTQRALRVVAVLTLALAYSACGSSGSTTAPSVESTETFTGSVVVGGQDIHTFTVANEGEVSVTLVGTAPVNDVPMGVGIGVPSGTACTLLLGASTTTAAGTTPQVVGLVSSGTLCVEVYDAGQLTSTISYTVTVRHP